MSFEFYALPDEQQRWLMKLVLQEGIWCLAWNSAEDGYRYDTIRYEEDLHRLSFESEHEDSLMFFIGRTDFSQIAWEDKPHGKELDFIKSQALQFVPSTVVSGYILLEGRLTIMRPSEYNLHGIDPKPLSRWYKQIRKSLTSIMTKDYIVVQRTTTGEIKEWHEIGVTYGAVTWRLGGHLLKQFPGGAVEFDVRKGDGWGH